MKSLDALTDELANANAAVRRFPDNEHLIAVRDKALEAYCIARQNTPLPTPEQRPNPALSLLADAALLVGGVIAVAGFALICKAL